MNLKLVTFVIDNTQFLTDAETDTEAIQNAIAANLNEDLLGRLDDENSITSLTKTEVKNHNNYEVEKIDNMFLLEEIIKRNDWIGWAGTFNIIVFNG